MRVLFIGGTGIISTACTRLALERGIELTLVNRGRHAAQTPDGARTIAVDVEDAAAVERALAGERFDAVVDWIAFEPAQIERDIALFRGRTGQYIFISSASAYQKPVGTTGSRNRRRSPTPIGAIHSRRSPAKTGCCAPTAKKAFP